MKRMFFPYLLSEYPDPDRFEELLDLTLLHADTVEIGIPFSDPVADGPILQEASHSVLSRGFRIESIFRTLQRKRPRVPVALMSYANPILAYNREEFLRACRQSGMKYLIVPDVPHEEASEWRSAANSESLSWISFISLQTKQERLTQIAKSAEGFIYLLSVTGITGSEIKQPQVIRDVAARIRNHTGIPIALGFGIRSPSDARAYLNSVDAIIVGSRIAQLIQTTSMKEIEKFFEEFRAVLEGGARNDARS